MTSMIITILVFLLVLSVLVLIHEAGHFFVAKKLGVKVEEFGFGFPPRIFGKKIGETMYSINALPIGGFVKLYGEDEAGGGKLRINLPAGKAGNRELRIKDDKRSFISRNPWQRIAIVVAGVVMNFLLAVVLLSYLFAAVGITVPGDKVIISSVVKDSPADKAKLPVNGIILSIDNQKITNTTQLIMYTNEHVGREIHLTIQTQKNGVQTFSVTPQLSPLHKGALGVFIGQNSIVKKYPWYKAPFVGLWQSFSQSWLIVQGLWTTVVQIFTKGAVPQDITGPVGIAQLTGQFIKIGPQALLSLVSLLSLNLAVLNILPIPALDGGRLFFILIEAVIGKKVNQKFEGYAHAVGMIFLLTLIALITLHDLYRIFTGQPLIPK